MNVAAAVDAIGGLLGVAQFPTPSDGHSQLLTWLKAFGLVGRAGAEGRTKLEVIRILKPYVAREVYHASPGRKGRPQRRAWSDNRLAPSRLPSERFAGPSL
ncbi:MAG TPA: hypothetical protein VME46_03500 [Acidimicrobiales bacterium]|nr:hypothetical protein [Acidimicrobiales bacterium]